MSEHTPGPWFAGRKHESSNIYYVDFLENAPDYTAEVCALYNGSLADARLIAAAPDMLAALKGILDPDDADDTSLRPEWRAVVAAIAKATGEKP